jgi:hypothetical protein
MLFTLLALLLGGYWIGRYCVAIERAWYARNVGHKSPRFVTRSQYASQLCGLDIIEDTTCCHGRLAEHSR